MSIKLENVYVPNERFTDDCFKTEYRLELVDQWKLKKAEVIEEKCLPIIFQRKPL